jgi:nucleoid-associated protein EbfC
MKLPEGMNDLFKRAQELQSKLAEIQAEAEKKTVEVASGGGMVTVVVNGKLQVLKIRIEPQVLESGDREMLEDLVVAAVNEGIRKAQQMTAEAMSRVTGGLKIPGLMDG